MVEAALSGIGLAYVWEERARPYVAQGRLIECLSSWAAPMEWLYLYYPTRRYMSAGLRAVIEAVRV
jgi:DNA-binding transcriptional LysR family regulator